MLWYFDYVTQRGGARLAFLSLHLVLQRDVAATVWATFAFGYHNNSTFSQVTMNEPILHHTSFVYQSQVTYSYFVHCSVIVASKYVASYVAVYFAFLPLEFW